MMMKMYSFHNGSIKILQKMFLIYCLLCASGVLGEELLIKNDTHISLELYNEKYLANQNRTWLLIQDTGVWAIYFLQFSLEAPNPTTHICEYDFLKIREIRNSTDHEDIYCGDQLKAGGTYFSTGPRLELHFKSDDRNEMLRGFEIDVFHAKNKGALLEIQKQFKQKTSTIEAIKAPVPNGVNEKNSPSLLVIGLASGTVVVSIIFIIIFIYFLTVVGKQRKPLHLHNILIAQDESMCPTEQKNSILLSTGRRYSKENEKPKSSKNVEKHGITSKFSGANYDKAKAMIETRLKRIYETSEAGSGNVYVQS